MAKSIAVALVISVLCAPPALFAQSKPFSFKGNALGMSLQQFKAANYGADVVWIEFRNAKGKKQKKEVPTPICSNEFEGLQSFNIPDRVEGEVLCDTSPGSRNPDGRSILDGRVVLQSLLYRFYNDKLYRIDMSFPALDYASVRGAFVEKYGVPSAATHPTYENGFGARWAGENVSWSNGSESIELSEGPGNGPGQDSTAQMSVAIIEDLALAPKQTPPKSDLDF